jgi:hypothetical protein
MVDLYWITIDQIIEKLKEDEENITSRNKGFGFLPQMSFAPDLARTGAKRGH